MHDDARGGRAEPNRVQLHLHRGVGWGLYGTATAIVLVLVLAGIASNLSSGSIVIAGVLALAGLPFTAFLGFLTYSMVVPLLIIDGQGISGRLSLAAQVNADWNEISIDVDDEAPPGTIRLHIGEQSVSVSGRSWIGFKEFIVLVASTPRAAAQLTSAARRELSRLLQIDG